MRGDQRSTTCYRCGSIACELHLRYPEDARFDVVRCITCNFLRLREQPSPDELLSYYQENYYQSDDCSRFPAPFEALVRWFRLRRARQIRRWLPQPPASILDVGCGRGIFLANMKECGYRVDGTQLSHPAAEHIRTQYGIAVFEGDLLDAPYSEGSFDLVTMWHVLEHTRNPKQYVEKVHALLKPGGRFLVEVPNVGCATARWAGINWVHWDIPRHLCHFTRPTVTALLEESGFAVERCDGFSLEYAPFGWIQAVLNLLPGPRHFLFETLSSSRKRFSPLLLAHLAASGVLAIPAIGCTLVAAASGNGDILTLRCRK